MSESIIRRAFETRLRTFASAKQMQVAWQNVDVDLEPTAAYLRCFLLPAQTYSNDLARRHIVYRGLYQVSVCVPAGSGPSEAESIVSAMRDFFPANTTISEGGLTIVLTDPLSSAPSITEPDLFVTPCSIPYRVDFQS